MSNMNKGYSEKQVKEGGMDGEREHLEILKVDGRIILRWNGK